MRVGVDFGGTKIEAAALAAADGRFLARVRAPTPQDYDQAVAVVVELIERIERETGARAKRIGVAGPGSVSPVTGVMRNANSTWLNGRPFVHDLERALSREVRFANDADCLAISEAAPDGAGAGARVLFAAILGTGCGGGIVVDGDLVEGRNRMGGEWGHAPLPWPTAVELATPPCWCGKRLCLETFVSGTGLAADHARVAGEAATAETVARAAAAGEANAVASLERYLDRLARGLAVVCNLIDPDVIVLGGGMSNVPALYSGLPERIAGLVFGDAFATRIVPARHGDSSGVRGAARLWP